MLKKRLITALWGIPIVACAVWFDRPIPWLTVLVATGGVIAAFEFYHMTGARRFFLYFGLAATGLLIISREARILSLLEGRPDTGLLTPLLLTAVVVVSLFWLLLQGRREGVFLAWAWMMAGILYVGWLLGYLVALRGLPDGRNWVFFALLVTFGSDTAAYFVGRAIGRHRMAPRISPAKTWEGAVAGLFGAVAVGLLFIPATPLHLEIGWSVVPLAVAVSAFGQVGDLSESLLKRSTGVKDSGTVLPGHGGVLDRIDSLIFAGVVVYYYVLWLSV